MGGRSGRGVHLGPIEGGPRWKGKPDVASAPCPQRTPPVGGPAKSPRTHGFMDLVARPCQAISTHLQAIPTRTFGAKLASGCSAGLCCPSSHALAGPEQGASAPPGQRRTVPAVWRFGNCRASFRGHPDLADIKRLPQWAQRQTTVRRWPGFGCTRINGKMGSLPSYSAPCTRVRLRVRRVSRVSDVSQKSVLPEIQHHRGRVARSGVGSASRPGRGRCLARCHCR